MKVERQGVVRTKLESRPIRVLHTLSRLSHGGIETWLMHIFRASDPSAAQHEILLMRPDPGVYDAEAERLGVILHRPAARLNRLAYLRSLDGLLQQQRYDVVHSHMYLFTGSVLGIARRRGVPIRIAHAHQAPITQGDVNRWQALKHRILRRFVGANATKLIGISEDAIEEIAGPEWRSDPRTAILIYGFDFSLFEGAHERAKQVRKALNLQDEQRVIGHVGRFVRQKNQELLVNAFAELARDRDDVVLVLVGEGPLLEEVRTQIAGLKIADRVILAGTTTDIPAYMAAFDLFVLTSRHEGLGIVAVEAQAAGTRCIFSDVVPPEADVLSPLIRRLPLDAAPERWAAAMYEALAMPMNDRRSAWRAIERSRYGLQRCVAELGAFYKHGR